jgi:hypothetical protein
MPRKFAGTVANMRKFRVYFLAVSSFEIRAITEKFILRGIQKKSVLKVKPEEGHSVTCACNKKKKQSTPNPYLHYGTNPDQHLKTDANKMECTSKSWPLSNGMWKILPIMLHKVPMSLSRNQHNLDRFQ